MKLAASELHELLCLGASAPMQRRLITALALLDAESAADYLRAYLEPPTED